MCWRIAWRAIQYPAFPREGEPPLAVTQWASDLQLDATTTSFRYDWLRETINRGVESTAAFTVQQLAYSEDRLPRLA